MSTMGEAKYRKMYAAQCEVIDAIAEALHVVGQPNDVVVAAAQEMKLRAFSAEAELDSAKRGCDRLRDDYDRQVRELRAELGVVRARMMTLAIERDTLRRAEDAERADREKRSAELLREIKDITASNTREKA